jgi:hypothetical protein
MISSNFPILIIIGIILTTISGSIEIFLNNNLTWISIIVIILFVGGLIIVYIFTLSINSNQKINNKFKTSVIIILTLAAIITFKIQSPLKLESRQSIFSINWGILIIIILSIFRSIILISKMIFHPSIPTKRIK